MNDKSSSWTIGSIIAWTTKYFQRMGIETPRLDAEVLLAWVLKTERIYLYVHFDQPLNAEELSAYHAAIEKRAKHMPVAYIVGSKEFMGKGFYVSPATLIPRPETELLVQKAVELLQGNKDLYGEAPLIADIGTGSGIIALSVLDALPKATADAVDISEDALIIAKKNANSLELTERVFFYQGNLFEPLKKNKRKYSAILTNPPYIPEEEIPKLPIDVRLFEPQQALVGGTDGLSFYRRICIEAPDLLISGGILACEVGIGEAEAVASILRQDVLIERVEILPDLAGIERVVVAWKV